MIRKITPYFKSFSFRIGFIFFTLFGLLSFIQILFFYNQTIRIEKANLEKIMLAYVDEIQFELKFNKKLNFQTMVERIVNTEFNEDLFIALFKDGVWQSGNWNFVPEEPYRNRIFYEIKNKLAYRISLSKNYVVWIGYNMDLIESLQATLVKSVWLTGIVTLLLSALFIQILIFTINKSLATLNFAYQKVISGDITHRIPLFGSGDQFEHINANFNSMLDWLNNLLHIIQDSHLSLSHDLKTPLSRLKISLDILFERRSELKKDMVENILVAREQTQNLIEMVDNLLLIHKAESQLGIKEFRQFDIRNLVAELVELYQPLCEEKKIVLELKPNQAVFLSGHRQLISQAIYNLLDNALKYSKSGQHIIVSIFQLQSKVEVVVADEGPGIPTEFREKVKEKFYRLDSSRHSEGFGLGLSLVTAVARLHWGQLILEDNNPGLKARLIFHGSQLS